MCMLLITFRRFEFFFGSFWLKLPGDQLNQSEISEMRAQTVFWFHPEDPDAGDRCQCRNPALSSSLRGRYSSMT